MTITLRNAADTFVSQNTSIRYFLVAVLAVFNILICFLLEGPDRFLSTFVMSILIIALLLVPNRINLKPLQAWCLGFMLLIAPEGIFDGKAISLKFGHISYDAISLYICLAFTGICFVSSLINLRSGGRSKILSQPKLPTKPTYAFVTLMYVTYIVTTLPSAYITFTQGRVEVLTASFNRGILDVLLSGMGTLAGVTLPAMITYFLMDRAVRKNTAPYISLLLLILPILAIQFFIGVRSTILATVISILFVYFIFKPIKFRQIPILGGLLVAFFFATDIMKNSRLGGGRSLGNVDVSFSVSSLYEGTVRYLSHMHAYFNIVGFKDGTEHATLFLFWVPRAVWTDKPAQLENWFHQVVQPGHFPYFHSIAATFAATGFADFGFYGGLLIVVALQGVLLGLVEKQTVRYMEVHEGRVDYKSIFHASALGLVFYSVRQFSSVPPSLVVILLSYYLLSLTMVSPLRKLENAKNA